MLIGTGSGMVLPLRKTQNLVKSRSRSYDLSEVGDVVVTKDNHRRLCQDHYSLYSETGPNRPFQFYLFIYLRSRVIILDGVQTLGERTGLKRQGGIPYSVGPVSDVLLN